MFEELIITGGGSSVAANFSIKQFLHPLKVKDQLTDDILQDDSTKDLQK